MGGNDISMHGFIITPGSEFGQTPHYLRHGRYTGRVLATERSILVEYEREQQA